MLYFIAFTKDFTYKTKCDTIYRFVDK